MTHRTLRDIDRELSQAHDRLSRYRAAATNVATNVMQVTEVIAKLEADKAALKSARPQPDAGVVVFQKKFGTPTGRTFSYAAISFEHEAKPGRFWSVTGAKGLTTVPWSVVADFIDRNETDATRPKVRECVPVDFDVHGNSASIKLDADTVARVFGAPKPSVTHLNPFSSSHRYDIGGL